MLEAVKLKNFKGHQSTRLNLDQSRLHALVGQNSYGKTSILQGLHYLNWVLNGFIPSNEQEKQPNLKHQV